MGILGNLFGMTAPGKYSAAKNALIAKYTYDLLNADIQKKVIDRVDYLLADGGIPQSQVQDYIDNFRKGHDDRAFYGMVAIALYNLGIQPKLKGVLINDSWEPVNRPLMVLLNADKEIQMVSNEIKKKHNITISLKEKVW